MCCWYNCSQPGIFVAKHGLKRKKSSTSTCLHYMTPYLRNKGFNKRRTLTLLQTVSAMESQPHELLLNALGYLQYSKCHATTCK